MVDSEKPQISGAVLRSYFDEMKRAGAYEQVLARVPPPARALAEKPPLPVSWLDSTVTSEFLVAFQHLRGRDATVEFGFNITKERLSGVLRPLLTTSLKLFGSTPASFFSRFEQFTALMIRGVRFEFTPIGDNAGRMDLRVAVPSQDAVYATWEGTFRAAFGLFEGTAPRVARTRIFDGGLRGEIDLSW